MRRSATEKTGRGQSASPAPGWREAIRNVMCLLNREEQRKFIRLFAVTVVSAFFQSAGVVSIFPFMNLILSPEQLQADGWLASAYRTFPFGDERTFILLFGCGLLLLLVLGNLLATLALWTQSRFVWDVNHRLSTTLLDRYLKAPYSFYLEKNSAELGKNVLAEVNEITNQFLIPLMTVMSKLLLAGAILLVLFATNFLVTLLAAVLIGGSYVLIFWFFRDHLRTRGIRRFELNTGRYKAVTEVMGGIKELKVLGKETFFLERFRESSRRLSELQAWHDILGKIPRHLMEIISFGGVIVLTLVILLVQGDVRDAIPLISLFAFAGYRMMPALQDAFKSLTTLQFSAATVDRIRQDLDEQESAVVGQRDDEAGQSLVSFQREIRFEHVSYVYPGSQETVIRDINLRIGRHETVGIVGPTGAGKTTLVDILLGLLLPRDGQVCVDDTVLSEQNMAGWRKNVGYVPQSIYLSDDTIRNNIAFGVPEEDIDGDALVRAAETANIHGFIVEKLPKGYDTMVGDRGIRLSGGQKQRIGLARALYHDPEVLVLDEATSALDGITEQAVIQAIDNASRLKTMVIIAHRLSSIEQCSTIYMMDAGALVDHGSYRELLERNPDFRAMDRAAGRNKQQEAPAEVPERGRGREGNAPQ